MSAPRSKPKDDKPQRPPQPQRQQGGEAGARQPQQQSGEGEQYGEGNYKATRDYNSGLKRHVESHDIEREARDAAPRSEEEARDMEAAERAGRGKAKGKDDPMPR